jgi:hypothetical protein
MRAVLVYAILGIAALAYLYDPPWLARIDSGMRAWETASDGRRYRWTGGHASFFVPASATAIRVPLRTTFAAPDDQPMTVTISIDDRTASTLVLRDDSWQAPMIALPPPGRRSLRRVDVRVDRVRNGNRGVEVGEVEVGR